MFVYSKSFPAWKPQNQKETFGKQIAPSGRRRKQKAVRVSGVHNNNFKRQGETFHGNVEPPMNVSIPQLVFHILARKCPGNDL